MPTAAEQEWIAATDECPRTEVRERPVKGGSRRPDLYVIHRFRRYRGALAVMEWGEASACIFKLEAGPEKGSGGRLLEFLKSIADKHSIELIGNVKAYETDACPEPDQAKTVKFYRCHGFHVGDKSPYTLRYPPPRC
jgi:hypothetical protein